MNVKTLETLACDAGWRNYHFVKVTTDDGVVGWSEFDEGFGAPGVGAVIERLAPRVIGKIGRPARAHLRGPALRDAPGLRRHRGLAMGAIENALLDAKAKRLGVPVYSLLGGKVRDRIRVYWSHCATWRINHPAHYKPAITDLEGVRSTRPRGARKGVHRVQDEYLPLRQGQDESARPPPGIRLAFRAGTQCRPSRCCATSSCTSRRCAKAPARTWTC